MNKELHSYGYKISIISEIMEYEESTVSTNSAYPPSFHALPINRNRFENQLPEIINITYDYALYTGFEKLLTVPPEQYREEQIALSVDFLRGYMESLAYEKRWNDAIFNSLVYPDIWLLHTGQQDVAKTLANIQNRLELYVNE